MSSENYNHHYPARLNTLVLTRNPFDTKNLPVIAMENEFSVGDFAETLMLLAHTRPEHQEFAEINLDWAQDLAPGTVITWEEYEDVIEPIATPPQHRKE